MHYYLICRRKWYLYIWLLYRAQLLPHSSMNWLVCENTKMIQEFSDVKCWLVAAHFMLLNIYGILYGISSSIVLYIYGKCIGWFDGAKMFPKCFGIRTSWSVLFSLLKRIIFAKFRYILAYLNWICKNRKSSLFIFIIKIDFFLRLNLMKVIIKNKCLASINTNLIIFYL